MEYRATSKKRTERRVVSEVRRGQILPGTSDYWEGVTMRVPALPPTKPSERNSSGRTCAS